MAVLSQYHHPTPRVCSFFFCDPLWRLSVGAHPLLLHIAFQRGEGFFFHLTKLGGGWGRVGGIFSCCTKECGDVSHVKHNRVFKARLCFFVEFSLSKRSGLKEKCKTSRGSQFLIVCLV